MAAVELSSTPLFTDSSLVALYKLENVNDSKGSNTLTNTNTVTFTAAQFNNGANFGAANTNKRLDVASNLGITTGSMSMSIWVKGLASIGSGTWELAHHSARSAGVNTDLDNRILFDYNGGTRRIVFRRYTNAAADLNYTLDIGTTNFYNLIYVFNGSTVEGYVNGVSVGTVSATSTTYNNNTNNGFGLASYDGGVANFASVLIDDVSVFSRALTASEASSIYTGNFSSGNFFLMF